MAHRLYDAALTARVAGDALAASRAQASRMVQGAVALRATTQALALALDRRDTALDRCDQARDRLERARAARAAFRSSQV